ncbi:lycopene cyclase domain-containing protein [Microbacterium sp. 179-I 3D3 NHS]|uniref:lycopene cyclase domain-containing protein n=1 Tax=unclassified Microbacterium TaxID=2609290 RepID=UPI00399F401F
MGAVYLGALMIALGCMLLLDRRFRLFFWRDAWAATVVTIVGVAFFLVWDVAGIAGGIFLRGEGAIATGVVLAPELPLEEPVFLLFLVVCTMVIYTGAARLVSHRRSRRAARGGRR